MTLGRRRLVRVPASSANLGPGFDVLAAALALHLELEVVETGTFSVQTALDVPRDRTNLIVRATTAPAFNRSPEMSATKESPMLSRLTRDASTSMPTTS